ncbi:MAG: thiamine pyrophosphate-dependent enzyme [Anaerolineales bacterium]|nr:thiamine pyrophosphate-dependent enzyme [Anaerolineales bacterium]
MAKRKRKLEVNQVGLTKDQYQGAESTLCKGCGHESISNQIVSIMHEMNVVPENIVKFSGIGCSSKSPTYFLGRSFGFNGLHGRMPSIATGAVFADHTLKALGFSGDGDTASIGMGQFKHVMRRNLPLVYIIENNGVYGLTKGQFSATADQGLELSKQGLNPYMPVDIVREALASNATFIARAFSGDVSQLREIIKAALSHEGIAVIDVISPCVSFNNEDDAHHSYSWGREHEVAIHDLAYVPPREEIEIDYDETSTKTVTMHDGSLIVLKKIKEGHDISSRVKAVNLLDEADEKGILLTGLFYINTQQENLVSIKNLPDEPLNRMTEERLRPSAEALTQVNNALF